MNYNWSNSLITNPIFDSNLNFCPWLSESLILVLITDVMKKLFMYMTFTFPIFQLVGVLGGTWSIAVVLTSKHFCFTKTKYFYASVFAADIIENLSALGVDKSLDFIINFNPQFISHTINNSSNAMCKIQRYTVFNVMFCTKHESSCVKFNKQIFDWMYQSSSGNETKYTYE